MDSLPRIQAVEKIVEEACKKETNTFGYGIWDHHILFVVKYGKVLAKKMAADPEIVEIAALLHDDASIKDESLYQGHHLRSALEADKILRSLDYPEDKILAVRNCIASHRASVHHERTSREAICLASADAMSHIDQVPSLLYFAFVQRKMDIDQGVKWAREKIERSWKKMCPDVDFPPPEDKIVLKGANLISFRVPRSAVGTSQRPERARLKHIDRPTHSETPKTALTAYDWFQKLIKFAVPRTILSPGGRKPTS